MSSSKQKDSITNWFKKSKTEKNNKKIEEEPLPTLPEIEWYAIF